MEHINEMPSLKGNPIYKYCYANLKKEKKNAGIRKHNYAGVDFSTKD